MSESDKSKLYQFCIHELIESQTDKYKVLEFLGSGSFGQVVKCLKRRSNELVALKVLKKDPWFEEQGHNEMKILEILNREDTEHFRFVRTVEFFAHQKHLCLAFEMLEESLGDFLLHTSLPAQHVSYILKQLLLSLSKLKELGVIHSDLKPDNIMVENPTAPPYRIKVIDFGSALRTDEASGGDLIQTLPYRAPEVLLGLLYGVEVDMWSLGCIVAELILKWPLYPGSNEYDQMRLITEMQGLPPSRMLNNGPEARSFFYTNKDDPDWRLIPKREYEKETGNICYNNCKYLFESLEYIGEINLPTHLEEEDLCFEISSRRSILDLMQKMLELDPEERITPEDALIHPAIMQLQPKE